MDRLSDPASIRLLHCLIDGNTYSIRVECIGLYGNRIHRAHFPLALLGRTGSGPIERIRCKGRREALVLLHELPGGTDFIWILALVL